MRQMPRRPGFTILEVLIVIGIMAVLFTLIASTVVGIHSAATAISCGNNERQIYAGMVMYEADNDRFFPQLAGVGMTTTNGGATCAWAMDPNYAANGGVISLTVGTLWPYFPPTVDGRQLAVMCPADSGEPSTHSGLNYNRNFDYSFNANLNSARYTVGQIAQPTKRIFIYEEEAPNDELCFGGTNTDDLPSGRHGSNLGSDERGVSNHIWMQNGRGNYCFFDGHVDTLSPAQIMDDIQNTPSMYSPLTQ